MSADTDTAIDPPLGERLTQLWHDSSLWIVNHSTRIVLAALFGALIVALLLAVKWLGQRLLRRGAGDTHWSTTIGRALAKTRLWFMAAVAAQIVATYAHAPDDLAKTITFLFVIISTLQAAVFSRELILGAIERRAADYDAIGSAMGIIRLLVTITLFTIAIILILSNLGVNVTGLVAGLGIGGIAIGLAAQGIFADLFAALSILFDRPFRKGDAIRWDTVTGEVEAIGLKTTRIRAITGEEIVISNTNILNKELHNLARLDRRRIMATFGLVYQTPPELCARVPAIVGDVIKSCPPASLVRCGMVAFAPSSLDFELQYDVHSEDYDTVFATRHAVNIAVLKRFAAEGLAFAYPTQTTFTAAPNGAYVMPYAPPLNPDIIKG